MFGAVKKKRIDRKRRIDGLWRRPNPSTPGAYWRESGLGSFDVAVDTRSKVSLNIAK